MLGEAVSGEAVTNLASQSLDRAHHPFGLTIRPKVDGFDETVFDPVFAGYASEDSPP